MKQKSPHHGFYGMRGFFILMALMFFGLEPIGTNLLHAEGKMTLVLKSSAFTNGDTIPSKYTSQGEDISPPLTWAGRPKQLAVWFLSSMIQMHRTRRLRR